jgi:hypothetical protein
LTPRSGPCDDTVVDVREVVHPLALLDARVDRDIVGDRLEPLLFELVTKEEVEGATGVREAVERTFDTQHPRRMLRVNETVGLLHEDGLVGDEAHRGGDVSLDHVGDLDEEPSDRDEAEEDEDGWPWRKRSGPRTELLKVGQPLEYLGAETTLDADEVVLLVGLEAESPLRVDDKGSWRGRDKVEGILKSETLNSFWHSALHSLAYGVVMASEYDVGMIGNGRPARSILVDLRSRPTTLVGSSSS